LEEKGIKKNPTPNETSVANMNAAGVRFGRVEVEWASLWRGTGPGKNVRKQLDATNDSKRQKGKFGRHASKGTARTTRTGEKDRIEWQIIRLLNMGILAQIWT